MCKGKDGSGCEDVVQLADDGDRDSDDEQLGELERREGRTALGDEHLRLRHIP